MSKSDTPFDHIDTSPTGRPSRSPKWALDKRINGFDSETADGEVFMLSHAYDGKDPGVIFDYPNTLEPSKLWQELTKQPLRQAINVWYNLTFDIDTILSNILNDELVHELRVTNRLDFIDDLDHPVCDGYEILYVKDKMFYVKDVHGHSYKHYDVAQFLFGKSLEDASQELLNEGKHDTGIDTKKFGKGNRGVNQYIRDLWENIKEYAKVDARLVRDIFNVLVNVGERELTNRIPMGVPISTGSIAESFMDYHFNKPSFSVTDMQRLGWKAFHGGRFEALKRGNVGDVVIPDINSAYPDKFRKLPNPASLVWKNRLDVSESELRESDYGFVEIDVTTDKDKPIQPFAYKTDKVIFPSLTNTTITVVKDVLVDALDLDLIDSFEIKEAWLGYETDSTVFPFSEVSKLYDKRQKFKETGQFIKEMMLKIALNSMYGKTCQTTEKRTKVKENESVDLKELKNRLVRLITTQLGMLKPEVFPNGAKVRQVSGRWFNPFLASYITGLTRMQLIREVYDHDLEYDTVLLATDSIMIERDAFESSSFESGLIEPGELGKWAIEARGEAFVVGNGIYEVETEDGKRKIGNRGFAELNEIKSKVEESRGGELLVKNPRPIKLGEVDAHTKRTLKDVGVFIEDERKLSANMDSMREWDSNDTFDTLLSGVTTSRPLQVVNGNIK